MDQQSKVKSLFYISAHFPPCASSGVYRTLGFLENLTKQGWFVTIFSLKEIKEERTDPKLLKRIPKGTRVIKSTYLNPFALRAKPKAPPVSPKPETKDSFVPPVPEDSVSFFSRLKESVSYLLKTPDSYIGWIPIALFNTTAARKADIILATAPPFSSLVLAVLLKKIWNKPLVIDFRDPWIHNPFRMKRPKKAARFDRFLEQWVFRHADHIVMNTEEACRLYQHHYPAKAKVISTLTNGFDANIAEQDAVEKDDPHSLWLVHVGTLYGKRSPEKLLDATKGIKGVTIELFGPGTDRFQEMSKGTPVRLHSAIPHHKAISLQKGADVTLVIGNCMPDSVQIPAKIFEALAIAKQIWLIDTEDSPTRKLLLSHRIPHFFSTNQSQSIALTLQEIQGQWQEETLAPSIPSDLTSPFRREHLSRELNSILAGFLPNQP